MLYARFFQPTMHYAHCRLHLARLSEFRSHQSAHCYIDCSFVVAQSLESIRTTHVNSNLKAFRTIVSAKNALRTLYIASDSIIRVLQVPKCPFSHQSLISSNCKRWTKTNNNTHVIQISKLSTPVFSAKNADRTLNIVRSLPFASAAATKVPSLCVTSLYLPTPITLRQHQSRQTLGASISLRPPLHLTYIASLLVIRILQRSGAPLLFVAFCITLTKPAPAAAHTLSHWHT